MFRLFEELVEPGIAPMGATFEEWFGIDDLPDHVARGVRPDERIPDGDSTPTSDRPTIPASDFDMLYNRMDQITNGRDLPIWTPSSLEEVEDAWGLRVEYGVPPILQDAVRDVVE